MQYTNTCNLPDVLVRALTSDRYSKNSKYSVTQLMKSPRSVVLEQRYRDLITVDVVDSLWLFLGSAIHDFLERGEGQHDLVEERLLYLTPRGISVSGKFDLYDGAEKILYDFKITSVYKVMRADYKEYQIQLSIYAWLLRRLGFDVNTIKNILILRDWSAYQSESVPQAITVIEHPILTEIDGFSISEWIDAKVDEIESAHLMVDEKLPECSLEYRWAEKDEYKVLWNESTAKTQRSMKNFDDFGMADEYAKLLESESKGKKTFRVESVPGNKFKRCEHCNAHMFCSQYIASKTKTTADNLTVVGQS